MLKHKIAIELLLISVSKDSPNFKCNVLLGEIYKIYEKQPNLEVCLDFLTSSSHWFFYPFVLIVINIIYLPVCTFFDIIQNFVCTFYV